MKITPKFGLLTIMFLAVTIIMATSTLALTTIDSYAGGCEGPAAFDDSYIYCINGDDVLKIDKSTMTLDDSFTNAGGGDTFNSLSEPYISGDYIYVNAVDLQRIFKINKNTMSLSNSYNAPDYPHAPMVYGGNVYFTTAGRQLYRLTESSLSYVSHVQVSTGYNEGAGYAPYVLEPWPVAAPGLEIMFAGGSILQAGTTSILTAYSGISGWVDISIFLDNYTYIGASSGWIYKFDTMTGTLNASYRMSGGVNDLITDGTSIFAADGSRIIKLDQSLNVLNTNLIATESMILAPSGNIITSSWTGTTYELDTADLSEISTLPIGNWKPMTLDGEVIYLPETPFYRINVSIPVNFRVLDDFERSNGNLDGTDNYDGYTYQYNYAGAQILNGEAYLTSPSASGAWMTEPTGDFIFSADMKCDSTAGDDCWLWLGDHTFSFHTRFYFDAGTMYFNTWNGGSQTVNLGSYNTGQFYNLDLAYDSGSNEYTISVDDSEISTISVGSDRHASYQLGTNEVSGGVLYVDNLEITTYETCTPSWSCNGYAACDVDDEQKCNAVIDINACGESYTGDYTEFTPLVCDYCTPSWTCDGYATCESDDEQDCNSVLDNNACAEPYTGDYTEFTPLTCDFCTPDWSCIGYADCGTTPTVSCNNVTDNNICSEAYAGDYSEFTPNVCTYANTGTGGGNGIPPSDDDDKEEDEKEDKDGGEAKDEAPLLSIGGLSSEFDVNTQTVKDVLTIIAGIVLLVIIYYITKPKGKGKRKKR